MKLFRLTATIIALICAFVLPGQVQEVLGMLLVVSIGILHGANDLKLLQKISGATGNLQHWGVRFIYTAFLLNVLGILLLYPKFAVFFFILVSAYHFGEQHLHQKIKDNQPLTYLVYTTFGITIFALLFLLNMEEIRTNTIETLTFYLNPELLVAIVLLFGLISIAGLFYFSLKQGNYALLFRELFNLVLLGFVFFQANLLWAFTTYFIVWHSMPALQEQLLKLYGEVNMDSILKYCRSSWLNWTVVVVSFVVFYYFSGSQKIDYAAVLIPFIAAVTLPHIIVSHLLQRTFGIQVSTDKNHVFKTPQVVNNGLES